MWPILGFWAALRLGSKCLVLAGASQAHLGYLEMVSTFCKCFFSRFLASSVVQMMLALCDRVLMTPSLCSSGWWESNWRY